MQPFYAHFDDITKSYSELQNIDSRQTSGNKVWQTKHDQILNNGKLKSNL